MILRLPSLCVLDLVGKDAAAILHNLTTNEIKSLSVGGSGAETFVTNVKGKCIGHVLVFRTDEGYRLIGAAGQSTAIAEQMDRYTIREDATPRVLDDQYQAWLVIDAHQNSPLSFQQINSENVKLLTYGVPWIGTDPQRGGLLILTATTDDVELETIGEMMTVAGINQAADTVESLVDEAAVERFHSLRVAAAFPWFGIDFDHSNLPQEVNREPETISFKKGCYLGQETIARLDALGQVQKKLVQWSIENLPEGNLPAVDTRLFADGEKPVGRLTSVARETKPHAEHGRVLALGFARRSHFDPGATATAAVAEGNFVATVVRA